MFVYDIELLAVVEKISEVSGEPTIVVHVLYLFDNLMKIALHESENNVIKISTGLPLFGNIIRVTSQLRLLAARCGVE